MTTARDTATAASLLARCDSLGIGLQAHGGRLRFYGRDDDLTPELAAKLQAHAAELLEIIGGGPQDGDGGPVTAGPQDLPGGDPDGADGAQDPAPSDSDAAEWQEVTDTDGRRCLVRSGAADLEIIDVNPCPVCGCLERWQDLAGEWHCERCSPRTRATRLREHAQRLREWHARHPWR